MKNKAVLSDAAFLSFSCLNKKESSKSFSAANFLFRERTRGLPFVLGPIESRALSCLLLPCSSFAALSITFFFLLQLDCTFFVVFKYSLGKKKKKKKT